MHPFLLAITGTASFALFLCAHVLLWRLPSTKRGLFLILKLSGASFIIAAIIGYAALDLRWIDLLFVSLPVHLFFTLLYLHLYIGTYRSLSVRVLAEILKAGGSMTFEELDRVYSKRFMFVSRIEILEQNDWIRKQGDAYVIAPKGKVFGRGIVMLRKLYGIRNAG